MHFRLLLALAAALLLPLSTHAVELGIDRLETMGFAPLLGKRVGLITNQTGANSNGVKTRLLLKRASGVNLVALFSPEHGLDGVVTAGGYVASTRDRLTGLPVFSLYGPTRRPTPAMLRGLDVLVFDLQDIGCRSYTYVSTMVKCMEAAGDAGLEFIVLDRPNPLGGIRVEGPGIEPDLISFVGQLPVPYVHGMTVGELAKMGLAKGWIQPACRLQVVEMRGWNRRTTWPETGLRWIPTSPNIPRATSPFYYVATGLAGELAGLETGVGGPAPFEIFASRGLDAQRLTSQLRSLKLSGVDFAPYSADGWQGVRLQIAPTADASLCAIGLHLLAAANRAAQPDLFTRSAGEKLSLFYKCYGSRGIRDQLERDIPAPRIIDAWHRTSRAFEAARNPYLLY